MRSTNSSTAIKRLMNEYQSLKRSPPDGIYAEPVSDEQLFEWEAIIVGPPGTDYEFGVFTAVIKFPQDYPLNPPVLKFTCPMFHPNVYPDGTVCISILHAPGEDPNMYELSSERWSPVQSVEKILLSVVSMLAEPNVESGANIDACKIWRDDHNEFSNIVRKTVKSSLNLFD